MSAAILTGPTGEAGARLLVEELARRGLAVQLMRASSAEAAAAARQSSCVILWWSDPESPSDWAAMTEAATAAAGLGTLVSVRAGKPSPPPQFASGGIDLSRWRGGSRNSGVTRLAAVVEARASASAPRRDSRTKWGIIGGAMSVAAGIMAMIANFGGVQQPICTVGAAQPAVSDLCGALGWANRPTRTERLAWKKVDRRSCEALRAFTQRFPEGVYHSSASDLLTARRTHWRAEWSPISQPLALFVGRDAPVSPTQAEARKLALAIGIDKGERRCRDFAASGVHRYRGLGVQPEEWLCSRLGDGHVCGFDGKAVCRLEARSETLIEQCGGGPQAQLAGTTARQ